MTQQKVKREKVASTSGDVLEAQIAKLRSLFPEAVVEGKIDFDKLKATLGGAAESGPGRFSFSWAGKEDAIALLQTPSRATLIPCPDESVNFETTGNAFIEGDNLEVLKLLFKPYFGRVKLIYIDPPYNTGQDFVYPDNYADPLKTYLQLTGQSDEQGNLLTSNPETSGRYHSAWLSMMYPRLFLARQLLRDDGVICVSIDDHEVHHLRMLMNEVFGEENFVATVIWQKMDSPSRNEESRAISDYHDYILCFAREQESKGFRPQSKPEIVEGYQVRLPDGRMARRRQLRKNGKGARRQDRPTMWFPLTAPDGTTVWPIAPEGWEGRWVLSLDTWEDRVRQGLTEWIKRDYGWVPYYLEIAPEEPEVPWSTIWDDVEQNRQAKAEFSALLGREVEFTNPKPSSLIRRIVSIASGHDDIVLDFFAGSCTTAQAVLELNNEDGGNRRFIMVQLPEPTENKEYPTIAEIGKERIRRVISKLKAQAAAQLPFEQGKAQGEALAGAACSDLGFKVFKLAKPNIEQWMPDGDRDPDSYAKRLSLFNDPLVPGWTAENVLWELALREGFGLNTRFEKKVIEHAARASALNALAGAACSEGRSTTIYEVTDPDKDPPQTFAVCLDEQVRVDLSKHYPLSPDMLLICRDKALDDTAAANLALQCRLKVI
jgi:adenine-specific DNA-methyltransferase